MPSGPVGAGQPSRSKKLTYVLAKEMGAPVAPSTNEKTRCAPVKVLSHVAPVVGPNRFSSPKSLVGVRPLFSGRDALYSEALVMRKSTRAPVGDVATLRK